MFPLVEVFPTNKQVMIGAWSITGRVTLFLILKYDDKNYYKLFV